MSDTNQIPTFNLKVVLKETGLKPDTLRAWERRYGLPKPKRSAGGHRLYSQHDIEIIKWLIARQQEGMSISRAVDLWRSLEADGQDPLHMTQFAAPEVAVAPISLSEGDAIDELRQRWLSACMAFEEQHAEQVLTQAFAVYPAEIVSLEILQKGLAEVGEGWYRGEVTVQQEHFTSELAVRRLEALLAATPPPTRTKHILIGCPPGEEHTFSPLLLTLFLRRQGWDVLYLGANVPVDRLETALATTRPELTILSAQRLHSAASTLQMAHRLQEQHVPLAYGGLIFNRLPALRTRIPGYFLGERLDLAPKVVEQLLSSPPPLPTVQPVSKAYQQALTHYSKRKALIEAEIWQSMEPMGLDHDQLTIAITHFGLNISAALMLGDVEFLGADLDWIEGLMDNRRLPRQLLVSYLNTYYQAARTHMDHHGAPVINHLGRLSEMHSK
jgi:DNA-binding transcriptional MerR regulator